MESIFPSQGPKAIVGETSGEMFNGSLTAEAAAKKKADEEEAKSDMFYMALAVLATLLLIAAMMVGHHSHSEYPSSTNDATDAACMVSRCSLRLGVSGHIFAAGSWII